MGISISNRLSGWALVAAALCVVAAPVRAEDSPVDAAKAVTEVVKKARTAPVGDKDTVVALKGAHARLAPLAKDAQDKAVVASTVSRAWNELLTTSRYHGLKPKGEYLCRQVSVGQYGRRELDCHMPVSPTWVFKPSMKDQLILEMFQRSPEGEVMRHIKVWRYQWNTVYSGVGGENYKKLAKMMHELDRDSMAKKGRKASKRVTAKKLSKAFPRAMYYYVQGFDVDVKAVVRRRNFYVKAKTSSFNFEVIDHITPAAGDDPVTKWQRTEDGAEVMSLLRSIAMAEK